MTNDRRRSPRVPVDIVVQLTVDGATIAGRLRDLSPDALLVEADQMWPVGTAMALSLDLPDDTAAQLSVAGQVVRTAPGERDAHAMAVLFTDIAPAAATRIDLFVERQQDEV